MHTVTDTRSMRGPNCDSDHNLVRIRCINKIMKMQARYNKQRMKWNSKKLEDAIISQKFEYGI
jgi:hypothetical protein